MTFELNSTLNRQKLIVILKYVFKHDTFEYNNKKMNMDNIIVIY